MKRFDKLFGIVGGALVIGFGVGLSAGLDSPPAHVEVQWETLVTGAAAIFGGWMAYSGATKPFQDERARLLKLHKYAVENALYVFMYYTDPNTVSGQHCLKIYSSDKIGCPEDVITMSAIATAEELPEIPKEVSTAELAFRREKILRKLRWFTFNTTNYVGPLQADPSDTRQEIERYLMELDKLI